MYTVTYAYIHEASHNITVFYTCNTVCINCTIVHNYAYAYMCTTHNIIIMWYAYDASYMYTTYYMYVHIQYAYDEQCNKKCKKSLMSKPVTSLTKNHFLVPHSTYFSQRYPRWYNMKHSTLYYFFDHFY